MPLNGMGNMDASHIKTAMKSKDIIREHFWEADACYIEALHLYGYYSKRYSKDDMEMINQFMIVKEKGTMKCPMINNTLLLLTVLIAAFSTVSLRENTDMVWPPSISSIPCPKR